MGSNADDDAARRIALVMALGLGTVIVGAFDDDAVRAALELAEQEAPLALLPVGAPIAVNPCAA